MTHKTIPSEKRRAAGVADSLIRLSTGLEDTEDLIEDLRQALDRIHEKNTQDNIIHASSPSGRAAQPEGRATQPIGKALVTA